jgi:hypothetical protein
MADGDSRLRTQDLRLKKRPVRLMVRTQDFHS